MARANVQSTFIFPHYRLIYRQTNDPDKETYFDTAEVQNGGLRPLVRIPGNFGRRSEEDLAGPNRPVHMQWFSAKYTLTIGHCPPSASAELHELLISSMRSNPIQTSVWEDATILPWSPTAQGGGNWLNFE